MKILNLYAGLGGNRRLWGDEHEITAVEYREDIAAFYKDQYPDDLVVVTDAHQYLLGNYKDYGFIWSSPPCPTHSRARFWGQPDAVYPDMALYQEILLLKHHFKGQWVVENVQPYYDPLIPATRIGRHLFWANYHIPQHDGNDADILEGNRQQWQQHHGIDITGYKFQDRTDKLLRNCVDSQLGLHILESATTSSPATIQQVSLL